MQELDSLQPPHVAYWAVVARRFAFPAFFSDLAPGLDLGILLWALEYHPFLLFSLWNPYEIKVYTFFSLVT